MEAKTLSEQREARRATIAERVRLAAELANADPSEPWVMWCGLNNESSEVASAVVGSVEITGSQPDDMKEQRLIDFLDGKKRAMVSKSRIAGFGLNLQHCSKMAFVGLSHSAEEMYQAIRRIYRFGQTKPCDIHIVISELDLAILDNVKRKQVESDRLVAGLVQAMSERTKEQIGQTKNQTSEYKPTKKMELPKWLKQPA